MSQLSSNDSITNVGREFAIASVREEASALRDEYRRARVRDDYETCAKLSNTGLWRKVF